MSKQNIARPTNWSKRMCRGSIPADPLADYRGGKPNRAQRRALKRKRKVVGE